MAIITDLMYFHSLFQSKNFNTSEISLTSAISKDNALPPLRHAQYLQSACSLGSPSWLDLMRTRTGKKNTSRVLQRAFVQVKCRRHRDLTVGVLDSGSNSPRTQVLVGFTVLCS